MRARRLGASLNAASGGGEAIEFPGLEILEPDSTRSRLVTTGFSVLVHGALIGALFLAAYLAPVEEIEKLIEITRIEDTVAKEEPAPAPKVIAESSRRLFDPSRMAVKPQIVSPAVVQKASPVVAASKLDMESLTPIKAPIEVKGAARVVKRAQTFQSNFQVPTQAVEIEAGAPAIRGPIEVQAPTGIQAGPRAIASVGNTVGIADPKALGTGSAVREGIASNRDVFGGKTGARAEVNWAVGDGNLRGSGGSGTGPGSVTWDQCVGRPEVQSYMERVRRRMLARWTTPPDAAGNQEVSLRFILDPAGTATHVELVAAEDRRLGNSAVEALRSASPFDHMPDRVRCLAGNPLVGHFRNPVVAAN
jgi:hypothetical protein